MYDVYVLVRTQILFPKEDLNELRELANERNISVSELVRKEIREKTLKTKKKKMGGAEAMLKLAEWAKKHKVKAPRDLSSNDSYLYGKLSLDYKRHFPNKNKK